MKTIEEIIKELPPEAQQEVRVLAESLLARAKKPRRKPRFDWAGALADMKDQYSSVELQHKISKWRVGLT